MGDGLSRAFELAVTPALFGALGYALDRWIGVLPVFTIVFVLVALIGMMLRTWYGYVYRMQALEEAGPWAKRT
jgi:F0F1-type ATP synthase assembly protein I